MADTAVATSASAAVVRLMLMSMFLPSTRATGERPPSDSNASLHTVGSSGRLRSTPRARSSGASINGAASEGPAQAGPSSATERLSSRIAEDPQTAVAVASEDVGPPVLADERLHAPEVVALRIEIAPDLLQAPLAAGHGGRQPRRAAVDDLDGPQAARVVRQVSQRRILGIDGDLVYREVSEPEGEVGIVGLGDRVRVERPERLGIEEPDVSPTVEYRADLDPLADRPDRDVLRIRVLRRDLEAEQLVEGLVRGADGDDLIDERARSAERRDLLGGGVAHHVAVDEHDRVPA